MSVQTQVIKIEIQGALTHIIYTTRKLKCMRVQIQNGLKNRNGELENEEEEEEETEVRRKKKGAETWDSE